MRIQPHKPKMKALVFAPLKKNRMDFLIEKATELGITDFYPVLTQNTETRKINEDRVHAQITEAAEQCERLTIPNFHPLQPLGDLLSDWPAVMPLYACLERIREPCLAITEKTEGLVFLIGPEGGFTIEETEMIMDCSFTQPVSLGANILRAETAALVCLAMALS